MTRSNRSFPIGALLLISVTVALLLTVKECNLVPILSPFWVRHRIESNLNELPGMLRKDPSGREAEIYLNNKRLPINVIQPYLYTVKGPLHEDPPGRRELVTQVEDWLAPYEASLIEVMKASARDNMAPNAATAVLSFSRPSGSVKSALLAVARNPGADYQKAESAYETLFMLQMDDAAVRNEIVQSISWRDELSDRADLASLLLVSASTRWGLEEMLPVYERFLKVSLRPENFPKRGGRQRLLTDYRIATVGLKAFGETAIALAPLLKARLNEMDPSSDSREIRSGKEALEILEGRRMPAVRVSWKGRLLGISKKAYPDWLAKHKQNKRPDDQGIESSGATQQSKQ